MGESTTTLGSDGSLSAAAKKELKGYSERAVALIEQREQINEDLTEVMNEAKDAGFDTKILRKAIKRARTDRGKLQAEEDMIVTYLDAIQGDLFRGSKTAKAA